MQIYTPTIDSHITDVDVINVFLSLFSSKKILLYISKISVPMRISCKYRQ